MMAAFIFFFYHENVHLNVYVQGLQDGSAGKLSGLAPDGLSSRCGTPGKRRKLPPRSYPLTFTHELWYAGILAHTQR